MTDELNTVRANLEAAQGDHPYIAGATLPGGGSVADELKPLQPGPIFAVGRVIPATTGPAYIPPEPADYSPRHHIHILECKLDIALTALRHYAATDDAALTRDDRSFARSALAKIEALDV